ncbi:transposase [Deltaproteobacteria bacterium OttesenSCG-928-K17]|nr:transposase [Deltaproteobacteria bacterium OttesenSCG-928-K17]
MARLARIVAPGVAHHVTQRGNRRQEVFFCDDDYRYYLELLAFWSAKFRLSVLAYCLMPNHVHLIVVPYEAPSLSQAIREIHQRYTRSVNFRENWRGHLWQGRFTSCPMSEPHLYQALHYVEMNPVRAGLVETPDQWKWSSAANGENGENDFPNEIIDHEWLNRAGLAGRNPAMDIDVELFRRHGRTGRPLGDETFISKLGEMCGRDLTPKKPGPKPKPQGGNTPPQIRGGVNTTAGKELYSPLTASKTTAGPEIK